MKISHKIQQHFIEKSPIILTIGFFDGMHLGHQKIFSKAREIKSDTGFIYTLTFVKHPKTVLNPDHPVSLITTLDHRVKLIEGQQIDHLLLIDFSDKIKDSSADSFIAYLKDRLAFTDLVLGPNSSIGKNKEGNIELLRLLSKKYSYKLHVLDLFQQDQQTISSTIIRKKIVEKDFAFVEKALGRPYSIFTQSIKGQGIGSKIGTPTINFNVEGLCLPPYGVYSIKVEQSGKSYQGIANLGYAPTLQSRKVPVLEVHLLDSIANFNENQHAEIVFKKFIRAEKKFSSIDELKAQIQCDIQQI